MSVKDLFLQQLALGLWALLVTPCLASSYRVFEATVVPVPGSNSGVEGAVTVFLASDTRVAYAGFALAVEPNLEPEDCTALNACGVHIHSGFSCEDVEGQEGHFFASPVTEDPWTEDRYNSDANGRADFAGIVEMGTTDIEGRAFIVHDSEGRRVSCGLLTEVTKKSLSTTTRPLTDAGVMGEVTVLAGVGSDIVDDQQTMQCFFGKAMSLEPGVDSFLQGGRDCTDTNGCGTHIHEGLSCEADEQLGHFYNKEIFDEDPWLIVGYEATDEDGNAEFVDCVISGESDFEGRAFILHAENGSRVSCGLLQDSCIPSFRLWDADDNSGAMGPLPLTLDLCDYEGKSLNVEAVAHCARNVRMQLKGDGRTVRSFDRQEPFTLSSDEVEQLTVAGEYTAVALPFPGRKGKQTFTVEEC